MTGKDRVLNALNNTPSHELPATVHWWGLYKFSHAGLITGYDDAHKAYELSGEALFNYENKFFRDFMPDTVHIGGGAAKYDNPERGQLAAKLRASGGLLESKALIDEYMSLLYRPADEILNSGEFDNVKLCVQNLGGEAFVMVNEGITTGAYFDPFGHAGFEEGLCGLIENPENSAYFLSKIYDMVFERVKALAAIGCHGYLSSETYCSADIMSPALYKSIIFPLQKSFFGKIKQLGMHPLAYFTGDILKNLNDIKQLGISGLMVEESKKGFTLDAGEITAALEGTAALFGNLDSVYTLQMASADEVAAKTREMLQKTKGRPFIMSNGCPVSFGTPAENIRAMLNTVREFNE